MCLKLNCLSENYEEGCRRMIIKIYIILIFGAKSTYVYEEGAVVLAKIFLFDDSTVPYVLYVTYTRYLGTYIRVV